MLKEHANFFMFSRNKKDHFISRQLKAISFQFNSSHFLSDVGHFDGLLIGFSDVCFTVDSVYNGSFYVTIIFHNKKKLCFN
jgi:hypothetical protein